MAGEQGRGRSFWGVLFSPVRVWWRWAGERQTTRGRVLAYGSPVVALLVIIIIASVAGGGGDNGDADREQVRAEPTEAAGEALDTGDQEAAEPTSEPTDAGEPTQAPEPTEPPEPTDTPEPSWETGPVTEATVREALDDIDDLGLVRPDIGLDNVTFVSVIPHWETDGYVVAIEFEPGTVWSETDMLTVAGESTLVAMAKLFANPQVDRVKISAMAELTDALGNTSTEFVTTATINRATADQINWQGFADRQLTDNKHIFCFADEFIIRPVIYNELGDKGCLPGPSRSEG